METNERLPLITPPGCLLTHSIVTTFSQLSPSTQSSHSHTFGVNQHAHLNDNGSVAHWRQTHFRPHRLPRDVPIMQHPKRSAFFVRLRSCDKKDISDAAMCAKYISGSNFRRRKFKV